MRKFEKPGTIIPQMYWVSIGKEFFLAELIDETVGLFQIWSSCPLFSDKEWTASEVKKGWSFRTEFYENLTFL